MKYLGGSAATHKDKIIPPSIDPYPRPQVQPLQQLVKLVYNIILVAGPFPNMACSVGKAFFLLLSHDGRL